MPAPAITHCVVRGAELVAMRAVTSTRSSSPERLTKDQVAFFFTLCPTSECAARSAKRSRRGARSR